MENYNKHEIYKNKDGVVLSDVYFLNEKYHRLDGPAYIEYRMDGRIYYEEYYVDNIRHRVDGPAHISYSTSGEVMYKYFMLLGEFITEQQFNTPGFIDAFILEHS